MGSSGCDGGGRPAKGSVVLPVVDEVSAWRWAGARLYAGKVRCWGPQERCGCLLQSLVQSTGAATGGWGGIAHCFAAGKGRQEKRLELRTHNFDQGWGLVELSNRAAAVAQSCRGHRPRGTRLGLAG